MKLKAVNYWHIRLKVFAKGVKSKIYQIRSKTAKFKTIQWKFARWQSWWQQWLITSNIVNNTSIYTLPLPPPSVFNASFLPDVPQFEPKISQLQNEPTAKQQKQVHFSIIEAILKPEEEKPKMSNKLQSLFPYRLIRYFKKLLQK